MKYKRFYSLCILNAILALGFLFTSNVFAQDSTVTPSATSISDPSPIASSISTQAETDSPKTSGTQELLSQDATTSLGENASTTSIAASNASQVEKPFYMDQRFWILAADVVVILLLLLALTIRILSKFASPTLPYLNSSAPKIVKHKRKSDKPLTVDELNIDIPV